MACRSTWIHSWSKGSEYYFQILTLFVPTYSSGVQLILDCLKSIHNLPPWDFLFTSNADALSTALAIEIIRSWLDKLSFQTGFQANYPLIVVKSAMTTIIRNNHFEFDNLNFLKLLNRKCHEKFSACMWATYHLLLWQA